MESEKININSITLKRLENDSKFLDYFINNIDTILANTEYINYFVLKNFLGIPKVKDAIMNNISIVIKKVNYREEIFEILPTPDIKKHIEDFFTEKEPEIDINYACIIDKIQDRITKDKKYILDLIVRNIDNIIRGSGEYLPITMIIIEQYLDEASEEQISQIDNALVRNIDEIISFNIIDYRYDFSSFNKMEMFKNEIRRRGVEFFINFPLRNNLEEIKQFSQELFGKFDEEALSIMIFGYHNKDKAELIKMIIRELLDKSDGKITANDIIKKQSGCFSNPYQIGDYVLKVGDNRHYEEMPNHRRILQPIIRRRFVEDDKMQDYRSNHFNGYFVEVQNLGDIQCWDKMSEEQIDDILFEIYCDMRKDDIVWIDIAKENAAKLIKPNKPNFYFIDIDGVKKDIRPTEEATGLIRRNS